MDAELQGKAERMYKLLREQEHSSEKGNITITVAQSSDICQILHDLVVANEGDGVLKN